MRSSRDRSVAASPWAVRVFAQQIWPRKICSAWVAQTTVPVPSGNSPDGTAGTSATAETILRRLGAFPVPPGKLPVRRAGTGRPDGADRLPVIPPPYSYAPEGCNPEIQHLTLKRAVDRTQRRKGAETQRFRLLSTRTRWASHSNRFFHRYFPVPCAFASWRLCVNCRF